MGFCSLNSVLVREEALYRLKGEDVNTRGKWLCDEVSPDSFFLHENSDYIVDAHILGREILGGGGISRYSCDYISGFLSIAAVWKIT